MSFWTHITGTITVSPLGRTQAEKRYILDTVLGHLPNVTGSEKDMYIDVIQKADHDLYCGFDEFGQFTDNLRDRYGDRDLRGGMRIQTEYILVVYGDFRDRHFEQTYREFQKWLCRLAKRVEVENVLVQVSGYEKTTVITNENNVYTDMWELPSWSICNDSPYSEPNWCEYLMWNKSKESDLPMLLEYKYFNNVKNDAEVIRRIEYMQSEDKE